MIDRQRIAAVKQLEALGYRFDGIEWKAPAGVASSPALLGEADAMHTLLILRADKMEGCTEGPEEEELRRIADAVDAYEAKRWPNGATPGGKGEWGRDAICNLYSLNKKRHMVARFFCVSHNRAAAFRGDGAPSDAEQRLDRRLRRVGACG